MNFEELDSSLPNGFHDGSLKNISINYAEKIIQLSLELCVSTPEDKIEEYKPCTVTISEFDFCIIDVPAASYPYAAKGFLWIDAGSGEPPTAPLKTPPLSPGAFLFYIWVNDWNSFIRIGAKNMDLKWD